MQGEGRRGMEAGAAASVIELMVDEIIEEYLCGVIRVLRAPLSLHDLSCMDICWLLLLLCVLGFLLLVLC
ncbi:hypothetical protein AAC387_Pa04g2156 [Persea americana]